MKTRFMVVGTLLVLILGVAVSPSAYAYNGPPEQQITPSDACANDPFAAYWEYGFQCGGESWSPMTCAECNGTDSDAGCAYSESDGAGTCVFENGQCYGWGSCHYTG